MSYQESTLVQQRDRVAARSVFFLLLALFTATFTGTPENADAEVEFQTTSALARGRGFALGGTPEAEAIIAQRFNVVPGPGPAGAREVGASPEAGPDASPEANADGERWYSWFGPGQALAGLPFYAAGRALAWAFPEVEDRHAETTHLGVARSEYFAHLLVGWRNSLFTALTAFLIVLASRRLGVQRLYAWIAGLTYGISTFAWPQARSTLNDVQGTFFLFLGFYVLLRMREEFKRLHEPRARHLFGLGATLAAAVLTRVVLAPAAAVLALAAVIAILRGSRDLARLTDAVGSRRTFLGMVGLFALPVVLGGVAFAALNLWRFGDPLETGYGAVLRSGTFFSYPFTLGLAGLFLSPGRGLLWMAPGVLLLPWGLSRAWHDGERIWPMVLPFLAAALVVLPAGAQGWHGGYTYGPRYLLPLLPFLWVGVGLALERIDVASSRGALAYGLLFVGLLVQLPAALVDHMTHQELAAEAARVRWPDPGGETAREQDEARFLNIQWDLDFAAPAAHWRILRHRVAGLGEDFDLDEIFGLDSGRTARPRDRRNQGFEHFAWVDLAERLGGSMLPGAVVISLLFAVGLILSVRSLDAF